MPGISPTDSQPERRLYYTDVKVKEGITEAQAEKLRFRAADPAPTTLSGKAGLFYYRYRLITGIDLLTSWERTVFSTSFMLYLPVH